MLKKHRIFCCSLDIVLSLQMFYRRQFELAELLMYNGSVYSRRLEDWKIGRVTECAGLEIRYTLFRVSGV